MQIEEGSETAVLYKSNYTKLITYNNRGQSLSHTIIDAHKMISISSKQLSFAGFTVKHPVVKLRMLIVAVLLLFILFNLGAFFLFVPALIFVSKFGDTGWLVAFLIVGSVFVYISYRGYKQILASLLANSTRISPDSSPEMGRIFEFVQRESEKRGMNPPVLYVLGSPEFNASTVGRKKNSHIFLYESLFTECDTEDLEVIVAQELAHIDNHDVLLMTAINGFYDMLKNFVTWFGYAVRLGYYERRGVALTPNEKAVKQTVRRRTKYTLAPIIWCKNSISRNREYIADADSAEMTSPKQTESALETLQEQIQSTDPQHKGASSLGLVGNSNDGLLALFRRDHPAVPKRINRIQKLYGNEKGETDE